MGIKTGQFTLWLNAVPPCILVDTDSVNLGNQDRWFTGLPSSLQYQQTSSAQVYTYGGNIALSVIPSHVLNFIKTVTGAVSIVLATSGSPKLIKVYAGAISVSLTPSGSSKFVKVYAGNLTVLLAPSHTLSRSYARTGVIDLSLIPNSAYQFKEVYIYSGNISLVFVPNAFVNRVRSVQGALAIALVLSSSWGKNFANVTGSMTLSLMPASDINKVRVIFGNIPLSLMPNFTIKRVFVGHSGLDLVLMPEGVYILDLAGYMYQGNIVLELKPESGAVRVYDRQGNILVTLMPNSEGGYALLELVKMNSGIEKTETLSSPLDFDESGMQSGIGKTVTLSSPIRGNA